MNQQRARRFRAAQELLEKSAEENRLLKLYQSQGKVLPKIREAWDSNVITPGTPFLERIAVLLHWYINDRMQFDPLWKILGFNVILSDAHVPGEGEHKIMDFIRRQRMQPTYNPNTVHCLYGADADLIMLGLATHEVHFYVIREVVIETENKRCYLCHKTGHLPLDCPGGPVEGGASEDNGDPSPEEGAVAVDDNEGLSSSITSLLRKPFQVIHLPILREYLQVPTYPSHPPTHSAGYIYIYVC